MPWESPPPFDQRDRIEEEIQAKLNEFADSLPADRVIGMDPISLMTAASSHPERQSAITMLKQHISDAKKWKLPKDLIVFGIEKALEWRLIRFSGSPDQRISASELEDE